MKKFFEKHDLFKLAGLFVLISIILSWLVPYAYYNAGNIFGANGELDWNFVVEAGRHPLDNRNPIGLFDWSSYSLLGFWYFTALFIFAFIVAGFYKFLGNTTVYQTWTDRIANTFKGKEKLLIVISTVFFAMFAGVASDPFITLMIIPFVITIFSKLKVNKLSALSATFGGVLVGLFGATHSSKIVGSLINTSYGLGSANVTLGFERVSVIILFIVALILITYFAIAEFSNKKGEAVTDLFACSEAKENKTKAKKKRVNTLPLIILVGLLFVITIVGYIPWSDMFGVSLFKDIASSMLKFDKFFNIPLFQIILGTSFKEFGNLDLFGICGYIFVIVLLIKIIYHIPMDKIIDSFGEGFKSFGKTFVVLAVVYAVLEFNVLFSTIPAIVDLIFGLGKNLGTMFVSGALTNVFTVDFQYTVSLVGSAFATYKDANVAALILQTSSGIISFIAPTSAILMVGLSMLDIKFKDYFKYIWKFLIALTVITLIVLAILIYA